MSSSMILIVDDEEDVRTFIKDYLELEDFSCLTAASGSEAIDIVKKNSVSMVVSDIRMPDGNGVQLLSEIREYNATIPVVLLMTGHAEFTKEEALSCGAVDLINKPIDMELLLDHVKQHLGLLS